MTGNSKTTTLFDYQERDVKSILSSLKKVNGVMYQLPTGGGKSVVVSEFIDRVYDKEKGTKILFLVHRRELVLQMEDRLLNSYKSVGVIIGEVQRSLDSNILLGSISTLSRDNRMEQLLSTPYEYVIIDEAHRLRTPSYDKIIDHLKEVNPKLKILGVTATPYREDKKDFRKYVDVLINSESIPRLIERGRLSRSRVYSTSIGDIDSEVIKYDTDYQTSSLSKYMRKSAYLEHLVDLYESRGEGRSMLVYCVDVEHARLVLEKYKERGYNSIEYIDGTTPTNLRESYIQSFKVGTLKIIVSIGTLTEGVDLPDCGCIQMARPTQSITLYLQTIGRGCRKSELYNDFIVLDSSGNTKKFGTFEGPREWSLNPLKHPSSNNDGDTRVVVKKEDGSYSEEEGDEFEELVEITNEEYIESISSNIESSEKYNEELETKSLKIIDSLIEILTPSVKGLNLNLPVSLHNTTKWKYSEVRIQLRYKDIDIFNLVSRRDKGEIQVTRPDDYTVRRILVLYDKESNFFELPLFEDYVSICQLFKSSDILESIQSSFKKVTSLFHKSIDISSIKREVREKKEKVFLGKLSQHLQSSNVVGGALNTRHINTNYLNFRNIYGGYDFIRFSKDKLLSMNEVEFVRVNTRTGDQLATEYKYLSKDHCIQIFFDLWEKNNNSFEFTVE